MSKTMSWSLAACVPLCASFWLVACAASSGPGGEACLQAALDERVQKEGRRELFFAVLEGLHADSVSIAAVDAVLAVDPASGMPANFVKSCPICVPALDAFRAYQAWPGTIKTQFSDGLAADVEAKLVSGSADQRFSMSGKLVQGWIELRFDALRLTPAERAAWARVMKVWREKGMAMFEEVRAAETPGVFASRKACQMCDAANAACGR